MARGRFEMRREIGVGSRIVLAVCEDKQSCEILEFFLKVLGNYEEDIGNLMDGCEIPQQVNLNFKLGDETLDGMYLIQEKKVSEHIIVIDIFTKHLEGVGDKNKKGLMKHLLETFLHELIHHKNSSEKKTDKTTKKLVEKILKEA